MSRDGALPPDTSHLRRHPRLPASFRRGRARITSLPMRNKTCAPRFSLALPVRFRLAGQEIWQNAKTRNLSSSGVLFRSRHLLPPGTMMDLEIELSDGYPVHASRVRARGEVVRQLKDESGAQD